MKEAEMYFKTKKGGKEENGRTKLHYCLRHTSGDAGSSGITQSRQAERADRQTDHQLFIDRLVMSLVEVARKKETTKKDEQFDLRDH